MKIAVLVLALLGIFYPLQLQGFHPLTFIYFLLFDLAYEMAGLKFNRIYDGIKGFYRVIG